MSLNKTLIDWVRNPDGTQGYTWNPITGCLNGCEYCYARKLANGRLKERYLANKNISPIQTVEGGYGTSKIIDSLDPFYPRFWEEKLKQVIRGYHAESYYSTRISPLKARGVFVCDMSDLFGIGIPEDWTRQIIGAINDWGNRDDRFYLLTKQPQNLIKFSPFPDNCWVGVTATNPTMLIEARHYLSGIEAQIKYVSLEPFLEWSKHRELDWLVEVLRSIDWVIIGAQTKPSVYPQIEWVEEIVRACDKAGVKVFLKYNLVGHIPIEKPFYIQDEIGWKIRQELPRL